MILPHDGTLAQLSRSSIAATGMEVEILRSRGGDRVQSRRRPSVDLKDHSACCDLPPPAAPEAGAPLWPHVQSLQPNVHGVWAVAQGHQGKRRAMEDRHRIVYGQGCRAFLAVYDGHGGQEAVSFAAHHLHQYMRFGGEAPPFATHDAQVAGLLGTDRKESAGIEGKARGSLLPPQAGSAWAGRRPSVTAVPVLPLLEDPEAFRREIERAFLRTEEDILALSRRLGTRDGTTAACVWIHGNMLYAANVGDARAVLCRNGVAVALTRDHKPSVEEERKRILAAGGEVHPTYKLKSGYCCYKPKKVPKGSDRLWPGGFSVSRALGDIDYKDLQRGKVKAVTLSPRPDVTAMPLTKEDGFVVLGTDGLFDVMTNQDVCDFVAKEARKKDFAVEKIAERLASRAYALGSEDNITALVAFFTHFPFGADVSDS